MVTAPGDVYNLGTFGGTFSFARGINERGEVVGAATFSSDGGPGDTVHHAFKHPGIARGMMLRRPFSRL